MKDQKAVQFKGFRVEDDDATPEMRYSFDRLQFSSNPKWLQNIIAEGRLHIDVPKRDAEALADPSVRVLYYRAPDNWHPVVVEENAWIIRVDDRTGRVVDGTTFQVVKDYFA